MTPKPGDETCRKCGGHRVRIWRANGRPAGYRCPACANAKSRERTAEERASCPVCKCGRRKTRVPAIAGNWPSWRCAICERRGVRKLTPQEKERAERDAGRICTTRCISCPEWSFFGTLADGHEAWLRHRESCPAGERRERARQLATAAA